MYGLFNICAFATVEALFLALFFTCGFDIKRQGCAKNPA